MAALQLGSYLILVEASLPVLFIREKTYSDHRRDG